MKHFIPVFLFWIMASACTPQVSSPKQWKAESLFFGSGGGFTGLCTTWCLLSNGQLFRQDAFPGENPAFESMGKLSKTRTRSFFEAAHAIDWTRPLEDPGNMYHFLEWKKGPDSTRLSWGGGHKPVPEKVEALYESLKSVQADQKP
jgi:hypothetical protein